MNPTLPLGEMSVHEKLATLEMLWDNLAKNTADIPAPTWHSDVLSAREQRVHDGASSFVPLGEMKDRIRKATR